MSTQDQSNTPSLEQSQQILLSRVKYPAFFQKLARDWNIRPENEIDAANLLRMGTLLRQANEEQQQKQASTGNQFLGLALAGLEESLGVKSASAQTPAHVDEVCKQAAFNHVGQDAEVAFAALAYADAISNTLTRQG